MLEFMLIVLCASLWRIGGAGKDEIKWARSWYRDILIPVIVMLYYWWSCGFLTGLLSGGATNSIRMGYGAYDPEHDDKPSWLAKITKDRQGWKIRGIYALITSFAIGLFPTLTYAFCFYNVFYHAVIWKFCFYIIFNVVVEVLLTKGFLKNKVWIVEPVIGASRALVFVLCR